MRFALLTAALLASALHTGAASAQQWDNWSYSGYSPAPQITYDYVYYPAQQVYFSPRFRTWYWPERSRWVESAYLPSYIRVDYRSGGYNIRLSSRTPYTQHVYVEQQYGHLWRRVPEWRQEYREERWERWEDRHHRPHHHHHGHHGHRD